MSEVAYQCWRLLCLPGKERLELLQWEWSSVSKGRHQQKIRQKLQQTSKCHDLRLWWQACWVCQLHHWKCLKLQPTVSAQSKTQKASVWSSYCNCIEIHVINTLKRHSSSKTVFQTFLQCIPWGDIYTDDRSTTIRCTTSNQLCSAFSG